MKKLLFILFVIIWQSGSTQDNKHWRFNFDGKIDGETFGIASSPVDNKIYFAGGFLSANGNSNLKNMARWNQVNRNWEQVPGINSSHSNFIRGMVADAKSNLYVGGDFTEIDGISTGKIAKFDVAKRVWQSLQEPKFS